MPLLTPSFDDRSYADLVQEARARIPAVFPAWTDHNPADPGIVLLELLAWLTELTLYRADQLTDESTLVFLKLLNGPQRHAELAARLALGPAAGGIDLDEAVRQTILGLRERYRAVTVDDFEHLVRHNWPASPEAAAFPAGEQVRRVRCVPRHDLRPAGERPAAPVPPAPAVMVEPPPEQQGHVSIVILPDAPPEQDQPVPSPALRKALHDWLNPRRLLGVRHHVVGPAYVAVNVEVALSLRADYAPAALRNGMFEDDRIARVAASEAEAALRGHLHPLRGGPDGAGWPFGRDLYRSELFQFLDDLDGVDYVGAVRIVLADPARAAAEPWRLVVDAAGELSSVRLLPHELPAVQSVVVSADIAPLLRSAI